MSLQNDNSGVGLGPYILLLLLILCSLILWLYKDYNEIKGHKNEKKQMFKPTPVLCAGAAAASQTSQSHA